MALRRLTTGNFSSATLLQSISHHDNHPQINTDIPPTPNSIFLKTCEELPSSIALAEDSSSIINIVLDKPPKTLIPLEHSSNNSTPDFNDTPLINTSKEKVILDGINQVSECLNQVSGDINEISGVQLVKNQETFEGFLDGVEVSGGFKEVNGNNNEISGVQLVKNQEIFKGFDSLNCNDTNNMLIVNCSDNNAEISQLLMNKDYVSLIDESVVVEISDNVGKKSRRRGKRGNSSDVCVGGNSRRKLKYSRKEMEKLRFVNGKSQKKLWQSVYNGFDDDVRKEYSELGSFRQNKNKAGGKRKYCEQGDSFSESMIRDVEGKDSTYVTLDGEDLAEWSEDEESDDEYQSIRRPAFVVEGEPNFESGPPEDGFEYLRRVRWEAAHIPQVKVVKLDRSKLTEQSVYMPNIPLIEKCPPHLAPLKQWEDEFIADFSELRLALSIMWETDDATSLDSDSIIFSRPQFTNCPSKSLPPLDLPAGGPTISTLIAMDPVTRVGLLHKRISLFESASNLSKDDYAWLFALCAVIDTPLDADTSASLRCLLRRCAKLRAEKDVFDDELVMLNILATVAGKVFGQSEN